MPSPAPDPHPCTIDEVVIALDQIIAQSIQTRSRQGYFAALYRVVTVAVRDGIRSGGVFEDGARMERLDVAFVNRYLAAWQRRQQGLAPARCWEVAFAATGSRRPIILQHLLLGMNAHINYDLGIAAASVCPGEEIRGLERDFMAINTVLAGLVEQVRREIGALSPWIRVVDKLSGRADDALVNFSMKRARDAAWELALCLAPLDPEAWEPELDKWDRHWELLGQLVAHPPGLLAQAALLVVRVRECGDVARVIQVLNRTAPGA